MKNARYPLLDRDREAEIADVSVEVTRKDVQHVHLAVHPPDGRVSLGLWGRRYLLVLKEREAKPEVTLDHRHISLQVRSGSTLEVRQAVLHRWHLALLHDEGRCYAAFAVACSLHTSTCRTESRLFRMSRASRGIDC